MKVIKRDGSVVDFDKSRISKAVMKALTAVDMPSEQIANRIADDVEGRCIELLTNSESDPVVSVEDIQDMVETYLNKRGLIKAAKSYILYRDKRAKLRNNKKLAVDVMSLVDGYINKTDWRVHENANSGFSYAALCKHISGSVLAHYSLNSIYPADIAEMHKSGDIHIHDLSCGIVPYCAGYSLKDLLLKGFIGTADKTCAGPAKHLSPALQQAANFLCTMQTEWAGAQAFSSLDTYMAPFIKVDNMSKQEVRQAVQMFLYVINVASRFGECVPVSYKCLKADGSWVSVDELKVGDSIITASVVKKDDGTEELKFKEDTIIRLNTFEAPPYLNEWCDPDNGFSFRCTPNHKIVYTDTNNKVYGITPSSVISKRMEDICIPSYEEDGTSKVYKCFEMVAPNSEKVWCPTTNTGTFICKTNTGHTIITGNSPFTNVTLDIRVPDDMKDTPVIIGGERHESICYKDCQKEMDMFNLALLELLYEGDYAGKQFSFPIPTYNLTEDFPWESPIGEALFKLTAKYGTPYFQNFINSDLSPSDVRSMCPLTMDTMIDVTIKDSVLSISLSELIKHIKAGEDVKVLTDEGWVSCDITDTVLMPTLSFKLSIDDKHAEYINMGVYHIQLIKRDDIELLVNAYEIQKGDQLPYLVGDTFEDIEWKPVINIKETGDLPVSCVKVDSTKHLFKLSNGIITHNCRLQLRVSDLRKKTGGLFGSGELTGSIGVCTINMPRIGYLSKTKEEFFERLDKVMLKCKEALEAKRKVVSKSLEDGLMPYSLEYVGTLNNHFSTIGLVGMNECCLNFLGCSIGDPEGHEFSLKVLDYMRSKLVEFQDETGNLYNLEATPAESCVAPETLIHTTEGVFTIKELSDKYKGKDNKFKVVAYNRDTNKVEIKDAIAFMVSENAEVLKVYTKHNGTIVCTPEHPFYVRIDNTDDFYWLPASMLVPGIKLKTRCDMDDEIVSVEKIKNKVPVYDLEVEDLHNFYIGTAAGALTHNTSYRLALCDKKMYPDIITAGQHDPYYTNSTYLPVGFSDNIVEVLNLQEPLQRKYTGGTVVHVFIGEAIPDWRTCMQLVKNIAENYRIPAFTITPTYSICPTHGYIKGEHKKCPMCKN